MTSANSSLHYLDILAKGADQVAFAYEITSNKFAYLNPAFERIWHTSRKRIQTNPRLLVKMVHPEDALHVQQAYQELLAGKLISSIEFRILLHDRTERWVSVKPRLLKDKVVIGYANDVSAQKEYADLLKKHSDKKNSILNIISHDLVGPLGNIHTLTQLLKEDFRYVKNEDIQETIDLIEQSSKQGLHLIQNFIKQEFLESANVKLIKRRVDLVQATRESMDEYLHAQKMLKKRFRFLTTSKSIYLELDDDKFMQAINNLISNAIKFTPEGGEITVALEEKESSVLIKVADTGIGIPQKYQAALFEKFSPARRTGIKGEPSVGLGMSIIKTIVEWHQGKIWFESQENKGTTFYIEIPKI